MRPGVSCAPPGRHRVSCSPQRASSGRDGKQSGITARDCLHHDGQAGTIIAPLRAADSSVFEFGDDVPTVPLCNGPQLAALILGGLVARTDAQIERDSRASTCTQ